MFSSQSSSGPDTPPSAPSAPPALSIEDALNLKCLCLERDKQEQALMISRLQTQVNNLQKTNNILVSGNPAQILNHMTEQNRVLEITNALLHQRIDENNRQLAQANVDKNKAVADQKQAKREAEQLYKANLEITQSYMTLLAYCQSQPAYFQMQMQQQLYLQQQAQLQQQMQTTAFALGQQPAVPARLPSLFRPTPQHRPVIPAQPPAGTNVTSAPSALGGAPNQRNV